MSKHLATIKGRYEVNTSSADYAVKYVDSEISLTEFSGGKDNGVMLQLSIRGDKFSYIQLTKTQVKELADELLNFLDNC